MITFTTSSNHIGSRKGLISTLTPSVSPAARELEKKIDELGEHRVAAFIAEPVQGAGGVIVPPESYWPEVKRILDERDILLISDEVICGFGRTGKWFGFETYGVEPDLVTFAKAVTNGYMPLGGSLVSKKISDVLLSGGGEFAHGLTYSTGTRHLGSAQSSDCLTEPQHS